jgi:serine phosphatase RsbU (regulator of sigma subunit)
MTSVAGDFYDFLAVDEHRLGILIADVSGHGMPAALIASMLKIAFAAQSAHALDPPRVLSGLNQALCGKFKDHYVTAAYALIDTDARTLLYAGAGHPPLLVREHSSGKVRPLLENGLFLGFFPDAAYTAIETEFREGDWLMLYTDGISESKSATEEQFGDNRLRLFIQEHPTGAASAVADALLNELSAWSGLAEEEHDDDVTLLAVHFRESAAVSTDGGETRARAIALSS